MGGRERCERTKKEGIRMRIVRRCLFENERRTVKKKREKRETKDERAGLMRPRNRTPLVTRQHTYLYEREREKRDDIIQDDIIEQRFQGNDLQNEWTEKTRRKEKRRQRKETEPSSPVTIDPSAEDGCPHPLFNKKTSGKVHIDNTQRKREKWRIEEEQFKESLWRKPTS